MPGKQHSLVTAAPSLVSGAMAGERVVSCEHASNRLPAGYGMLGLSRAQLDSHIGWDAGAEPLARALARCWRCPLHVGRYSRLLADLNRSEHNRKWIARESFGHLIPGNQDLTEAERRRRRDRYWLPYRTAVIASIEDAIARAGRVIHWSIHSFYPRGADIGLLYDSSRRFEKRVVGETQAALREAGFSVRRNFPYRGTSDGLTTHCRRLFGGRAYAGIEVEINQKLVDVEGALQRIGAVLCQQRQP